MFQLRNISITRQSMTHMIVNLKSYLMFELLEGGWKRLVMEVEAATTLDEVIEAHDRYLDGIVRKSLLRTDSEESIQHQLADQVQTILNICNQFCDFQENLFQEALYAADVASEKRLEAERRMTQGNWGFNSEADITEEETFFGLADPSILREVKRTADFYNETALQFLRVLNDKVNGNSDDFAGRESSDASTHYDVVGSTHFADIIDDDLDSPRFLVAQLDHNSFYGSQVGR